MQNCCLSSRPDICVIAMLEKNFINTEIYLVCKGPPQLKKTHFFQFLAEIF